MPKKRLIFEQPGHANHPRYDEYMTREIDDILMDPISDDMIKVEQIRELINNTKSKLEMDVLLGNKDVNNLFF